MKNLKTMPGSPKPDATRSERTWMSGEREMKKPSESCISSSPLDCMDPSITANQSKMPARNYKEFTLQTISKYCTP